MIRPRQDSNPGPLGQKSIALTTEPKSRLPDAVVRDWIYTQKLCMICFMQIFIIAKTLQKSSSLEPKGQWPWALACSIGPIKVCSNDDLGLTLTYFMARSNLVPYAFICKWPVTWGIRFHKNSDPMGLSATAPGLYTCIKTSKNVYKIRL